MSPMQHKQYALNINPIINKNININKPNTTANTNKSDEHTDNIQQRTYSSYTGNELKKQMIPHGMVD